MLFHLYGDLPQAWSYHTRVTCVLLCIGHYCHSLNSTSTQVENDKVISRTTHHPTPGMRQNRLIFWGKLVEMKYKGAHLKRNESLDFVPKVWIQNRYQSPETLPRFLFQYYQTNTNKFGFGVWPLHTFIFLEELSYCEFRKMSWMQTWGHFTPNKSPNWTCILNIKLTLCGMLFIAHMLSCKHAQQI